MSEELKLASLFDGSGGFPLAGMIAGIKPVWASEIEPFPIRVTTKRLPFMKHYGDVSTINGGEVEPVDIITFGSPCFPAGTLVLTDRGYLPIEELAVGMKVLTHTGKWKAITDWGYKTAPTVKVRGNHYGLECTPNHPIYSSVNKQKWGRLPNGKRHYEWKLEEPTWTNAEDMYGKLWACPRYVESLELPIPTKETSKQKDFPEVTENLFYFIGRWLGDGWTRTSQRSDRPEGQKMGQVIICDNINKEEEVVNTFKGITEIFCVSHERTSVRVSMSSQVLANWLEENFGKYSYGKQLPGWVFGMKESYRKSLLQGILDSDGYKIRENKFKLTTVSKSLAESIRILAETLGYSSSITYTIRPNTTIIEGRIVNQRNTYQVVCTKSTSRIHYFDELHGWYKVRSVTPTNETKTVYNISVEDDNSYIADGVVVHNCQDLSVAGKRSGLTGGERSILFYQAIRIIKEMREATNGKYPRWAVWENVPGAFSSNEGEDFKCVLEAFCRIKDSSANVPEPPEKRWADSGEILADGYSIGWRVLDAQYWSCAQRRRRIFLVADFAGGSAGKVLFESESVSGYSKQGFKSWEGFARLAESGLGDTSQCIGVDHVLISGGTTFKGKGWYDDISGCLKTQPHGVCCPKETVAKSFDGYNGSIDDVSSTLGVNCGMSTGRNGCIVLNDQGGERMDVTEDQTTTLRAKSTHPPVVVKENKKDVVAFENHRQDTRYTELKDTMPTVTASYGTGGNNTPFVVQKPKTLKIRSGCEGGGKGPLVQEDMSATLSTVNDQTVFVPFCRSSRPKFKGDTTKWKSAKVANTLNNFDVGESRCNEVVVYGICSKDSNAMKSDNPNSGIYEAKTSRTLDCNGANPSCNQGGMAVVAFSQNQREEVRDLGDKSGSLAAESGTHQQTYVLQGSVVGRKNKNNPKGDGISEDVSYTLNTMDRHAVAYGIDRATVNQGKNAKFGITVDSDVQPTMVARGPGVVGQPIYATSKASYHTLAEKDVAPTLVASDYKDPTTVCYGFDPQACRDVGQYVLEDQGNTLTNGTNPGWHNGALDLHYIVRRLTPTECARLQGFPDWWCSGLGTENPTEEDIKYWKDVFDTWNRLTADEEEKAPKTDKAVIKWLKDPYSDSAEYKMWGNGVALPCVCFVLFGIAYYGKGETK